MSTERLGTWTGLAKRAFRPALFLPGLALAAVTPHAASAQVTFGADIVSRYVWRGVDFGESVSVQPALTVGMGGFEVGAWASYAVSAAGASANENDLWASYTFDMASGSSFTLGVTDYYFPAPQDSPHDYGFSDRLAHSFEAFGSFTGPERFPLTVYAGFFLDTGDALYLEASLPIEVRDVELTLHAGGAHKANSLLQTTGGGLTNLGLSASKSLEISDSFSPAFGVSYILNPHIRRSYLVASLGL